MNMRVQRTRTKQLRAPLTTMLSGIRKVCSAISTHVRSIINWIIPVVVIWLTKVTSLNAYLSDLTRALNLLQSTCQKS